ncbi:aspartate-semialdehyde dehydrogenase [Synechococcus sp. PCC 6717]|uniref:Aspartate-semialdehyde dehydrogenase n=1 Tax=Parathermosynechococcus lividus PCC 6715 TaxID=1917166 RepID=A0A2D2Q473_PARLV|nr:aspartate-semialdehyde dehydrogenase [Thermostichus lividus]ATS19334.1 aspartate-semialdehyde dehydrogenase [Thermostichus lividus PCC 6715]MCH9056815.1 aspartate-semialdehyde dehydrogenase [Synechococcus sp. PCC 6716]MCI3281020.1 aspartate-semialdehyde dehydrogenase [Synechococcus sp. PCC 6717]
MAQGLRVGVLGATGAVGTEILGILAQRSLPIADLRLLASPRSAGQTLTFAGTPLPVQAVSAETLQGLDLILASAGASVSRQWLPIAVQAGAIAIDNSSAYRMEANVPLVVPEVNPQDLKDHQGIIANPNCTTILMTVALWPLHQVRPIRRIIAATYQSASGAGAKAMQELKDQALDILKGNPPRTAAFPYPLAFNLFPHNSPLNDQGYCQEEMKMINETRKIFHTPDLRLSATCVRVPVLRAHSEALNVEFFEPFPLAEARNLLQQAAGVAFVEDWERNYFPMPLEATGKDPVFVGRLRQDLSEPNALELWLCGDQIRKGAALNAVQIAESLIAQGLI